jgi:hypothetical protein
MLLVTGALAPATVAFAGRAEAQVGGSLSIAAPASANLSSGTPTNAGSLSTQIGTVTVSDTRTGILTGWTASVTSTNFTTGAGTTNETITNANIAYWSGAATATTGVGTFTPGQPTAAQRQTLSTSRTAFSAASVAGTTASWNPTLVVAIPPSAVIGQYHGTITHSVA